MLQHEYERLMGCKVEEEEFDKANCVYMASSMDKGPFCEMWKGAKEDAREYMYEMARGIYARNNEICELKKVREVYAKSLVDGDGGMGEGTSEAERLMGKRWVMVYKAEMGYRFTDMDVEWLKWNLR